MGAGEMNREIPSSTLATLRGILVSSLSRENLGPHDLHLHENVRHRPYRKVHFREGIFRNWKYWIDRLVLEIEFAKLITVLYR